MGLLVLQDGKVIGREGRSIGRDARMIRQDARVIGQDAKVIGRDANPEQQDVNLDQRDDCLADRDANLEDRDGYLEGQDACLADNGGVAPPCPPRRGGSERSERRLCDGVVGLVDGADGAGWPRVANSRERGRVSCPRSASFDSGRSGRKVDRRTGDMRHFAFGG